MVLKQSKVSAITYQADFRQFRAPRCARSSAGCDDSRRERLLGDLVEHALLLRIDCSSWQICYRKKITASGVFLVRTPAAMSPMEESLSAA